ncbi:MAG TPA: hypothetical protein DHV28_09575 [Ignavibacteriales bacterium]|nr:hypothetical protein [Ignavibacteriales bacterium]
MPETVNTTKSFSDYVYVLFKWKKLIIITLLILGPLTLGLLFLIPNNYKATAVVMIPPESNMGLGGLTGLLSGKNSATSLGSKLLGGNSANLDPLMAILNSRTVQTDIIKQFGLIKYYDVGDDNLDKTLKAFRGDISFEPTEYGMIEISVINEDPKVSAEIANYFSEILDSLNIVLNSQSAMNNRIFIEKRYLKNLVDLKSAEDSLSKLQKKYGIFAIPQQLEVAVKSAAEIEAQLAERELMAELIKTQYGEDSPSYLPIKEQVDFLKRKISDIKNSTKLSNNSNVLLPFKNLPELSMQYLRDFRELEIQQKILEVTLPLYEQAKVEEQKSIPTIMVLDKAVPPQIKNAPKRATTTIVILLLIFFVLLPVIFRGEKALTRSVHSNSLEVSEFKFFNKVKKIYRLKF